MSNHLSDSSWRARGHPKHRALTHTPEDEAAMEYYIKDIRVQCTQKVWEHVKGNLLHD